MTKYLFLYSTTDGHTKRICEFIGNILKQKNHEIKIYPISLELEKLGEYDAIILGASIRYGKYQKSVFNFINKHKDLFCLLYTSPSPRDATLSRMPSSA